MPFDILQAFARLGTDRVYDSTEAALAEVLGRSALDLIADPTTDNRGRIYQRARLACSFAALALTTNEILQSLPVNSGKVH